MNNLFKWDWFSNSGTGGGGGSPVLPTDIPNLMYWYDMKQEVYANDALVNLVTDRSGNGRNISQSSDVRKATFKTNILNTHPVLRFGGTRYYSPVGGKPDIDWMHQGDSTIFWVVKSNADDIQHYLFDSLNSTANNIGRQMSFSIISSGVNGSFRDFVAAGGGNIVYNNLLPTANSTPKDVWLVIVCRFEQALTIANSTIHVDNVLQGSATDVSAVSVATCSVTPVWFIRSTLVNGLNGDFAEGFGYNRALTDDEIASLVGGINNTYEI